MHSKLRLSICMTLFFVSAAQASASEVDPAPNNTEVLELIVDEALRLELDSCLAKVEIAPKAFRRCLSKIAREPSTVAGYEAAAIERTFQGGSSFGTGQIELTSVASLFGLWNGAAFSIAALAFGDSPGSGAILVVGASALAFGAGYGVGGSLLGRALKLDVGQSRLTASGLIWGTVVGLEVLPLLNQVDLQGGAALALPLLTVVGAGFLGGGTALFLSQGKEINRAQVSLFNTGGGVGTFVGLAFVLAAELPATASTLTLLTTTGAGLATGALAGQFLDMTWGQTLLIDFGAIAGIIAMGTVGFFAGAQSNDLPPIFFSAMVSTGAVGGAVAAGALVNYFDTGPLIKPTGGISLVPTILLDRDDKAVFGIAAYGVTF